MGNVRLVQISLGVPKGCAVGPLLFNILLTIFTRVVLRAYVYLPTTVSQQQISNEDDGALLQDDLDYYRMV